MSVRIIKEGVFCIELINRRVIGHKKNILQVKVGQKYWNMSLKVVEYFK